jgi:predicted RNase H-like HicB family nuclease
VTHTRHSQLAVVFLHEDNGTISAYLPDLPGVYAAAGTPGGARRDIREAPPTLARQLR